MASGVPVRVEIGRQCAQQAGFDTGSGARPGYETRLWVAKLIPASVIASVKWESGMFKLRTVCCFFFLTFIDVFKFPISSCPDFGIL